MLKLKRPGLSPGRFRMKSVQDLPYIRDVSNAGCDHGVEDPALLIRIAWSRRWQSRQLSVECAERAATLLRNREGEKVSEQCARANVALAWQAKWRGHFDEALERALAAEKNLPEAEFICERSELYAIMGVVHCARNRLDLADGAIKRALKLISVVEAPNTRAELLTVCASIHIQVGDLRSAGEVLGKARNIAGGETLARVEHNVARWLLTDRAPKHALDHAQTSLMLCTAHQNNVIRPYAHELAGACLVELGEIEDAKEHFADGLDVAVKDLDTRAQCQIIGRFGGLEQKQDSLERARDLYLYGTEIAKSMNYSHWEKVFARRMADVYEGLGDLPSAVEYHKRAWKLEEEKRL